jgi:hypothetical protein
MTINMLPPGKKRLGRIGEAAVLAAFGGLLACAFIAAILAAANDSPSAALAVGWAFFLWPGAADSLLVMLHARPVFAPSLLVWTAFGVGSFVGWMDGLWGVHRWRALGLLGFLLDVTWGLAGSTSAVLVHLLNMGWGRHADDPRIGAHRYLNGFRVKGGYAITLGSAISNLPAGAEGLMPHELLHVWQNRIFGPFYTLTYLAWMAVMLLPALVLGLSRRRVVQTVEDWCYLNNPWESWAYRFGGWRDPRRVWNRAATAAATVVFFVGFVFAAAICLCQIWLR